jgi:raffinose/stachyose/melibiose transport system permease protein
VAPISTPVFATVIVFNVLYVWNEFPLTVTMIYRPEMYNISLGVSLFRSKYGIDYSGIVAGTVLVVIPQLVFYGLFQRHIVKGLTSGAIKG